MFDRSKLARAATAVLVAALVATVVVSAAVLLAPARTGPVASGVAPAGGATEQWAFGGSASAYYTCSEAACFNGTSPGYSFSLTLQYFIEWVVIYTQTNLSATQTEYGAQAALNATLKETVVDNGTTGVVSLAGKETAAGFTNVSSTGSVWINTGGPVGPTTALAVLDASSSESFNFSGAYSISNSTSTSTLDFDIGANEASSVTFGSPLGVVPLSPTPGESWNSSAPFSASGSWTAGYSISGSYGAESETFQNWTTGAVAPSGTLFENGTDLGEYTLWDNYTSPPTSTSAQLILIDFGNGTFGAQDGWLLIPTGLYGSIFGSDVAGALTGGPVNVAAVPAQTSAPSFASSEDAYYHAGSGFIGASGSGSGSTVGQSGGPTVSVSAGPEPTSVAQQQYSGITSGGTSGAPSTSFPWAFVVIGAVVAVAVLVGAMGAVARSRRRRPPAAAPGYVPPMYAGAAGGPSGPQGPAGPAQEAPAGYAASAAAAPAAITPPAGPVCPNCGQAGTYIAQYGRYYCYQDQAYL